MVFLVTAFHQFQYHCHATAWLCFSHHKWINIQRRTICNTSKHKAHSLLLLTGTVAASTQPSDKILKFRFIQPTGCSLHTEIQGYLDDFCYCYLFIFLWDGSLNQGLCICKAGALPLETQLQSIMLWLFRRWGLVNYLPRSGLELWSSQFQPPK
jgi:hypothetical protein